MAIVSITPGMAGSGFPMGLMPGAFPSDHASRQTLNITATRLLFGQSQFTFLIPYSPPGLHSCACEPRLLPPQRSADRTRSGKDCPTGSAECQSLPLHVL